MNYIQLFGSLIVGGSCIIILVIHVRRSLKTNSWLKITGTVTDSQFRSSLSRGDKGNIIYEYIVNGETYFSDKIKRHGLITPEKRKEFNTIPKGSSIDVYYDPVDPKMSVLEPGMNIVEILVYFCIYLLIFIFLNAFVSVSLSMMLRGPLG